jgi:hypothetical protein
MQYKMWSVYPTIPSKMTSITCILQTCPLTKTKANNQTIRKELPERSEGRSCVLLFLSSTRAIVLTSTTYQLLLSLSSAYSAKAASSSHIRNRLSAQSTRALMCLGAWSGAGYAVSAECLAETRKENVSRNGVLDPWDQVPFVIGTYLLTWGQILL